MTTDTITISPAIQHAIDASRGSQTGAIVACAFGVDRDHKPRFTGHANVTSDGFVMCNFVTKDGEAKWGAFVGAYSDFKRNIEGLIKFAKLEGDDRATFVKTLNGWIARSYAQIEPIQ